MPIYLCDIDGTIADHKHRLHHIKTKPKNYQKFYDEMDNDRPIENVIDLIEQLYSCGNKIVFVSGRPDSHRDMTINWIHRYYHPYVNAGRGEYDTVRWEPQYGLYMRKDGDYRSDVIVKGELLDQILKDHNTNESKICGVFDDRPSVIKMWRDRGLTVFRVGDWDDE